MRKVALARKSPLKRSAPKRRSKGISPASSAQRLKARNLACIVTGQQAYEGATIDAAHVCPRSHGGCDSDLCVVPLRRDIHRAFDDGEFDLLPYLRPHHDPTAWLPEILHALEHYEGNVIDLTERLTGERVEYRGVAA